ncbi:MAG: hypothetical protein AB1629_00375 [Candidatus Omnitrophota bacterium]
MKNKAVTLTELLVATMILAVGMLGFVSSYRGYKKLAQTVGYRYTAYNLARECVEWAESGRMPHPLGLKYMYEPGTNCVTDFDIVMEPVPPWPYTMCDLKWQGADTTTVGYGLKSWTHYDINNTSGVPDPPGITCPFDWIGDIEVKKLVPKSDYKSVKITFIARKWPLISDLSSAAFQTDVRVQWKEEGKDYVIYLGTIPIKSTNDQLQLNLGRLRW